MAIYDSVRRNVRARTIQLQRKHAYSDNDQRARRNRRLLVDEVASPITSCHSDASHSLECGVMYRRVRLCVKIRPSNRIARQLPMKLRQQSDFVFFRAWNMALVMLNRSAAEPLKHGLRRDEERTSDLREARMY